MKIGPTSPDSFTCVPPSGMGEKSPTASIRSGFFFNRKRFVDGETAFVFYIRFIAVVAFDGYKQRSHYFYCFMYDVSRAVDAHMLVPHVPINNAQNSIFQLSL